MAKEGNAGVPSTCAQQGSSLIALSNSHFGPSHRGGSSCPSLGACSPLSSRETSLSPRPEFSFPSPWPVALGTKLASLWWHQCPHPDASPCGSPLRKGWPGAALCSEWRQKNPWKAAYFAVSPFSLCPAELNSRIGAAAWRAAHGAANGSSPP